MWNGDEWHLEPITEAVAGAGLLALDAGCHPFVALGDVVYSRSANGWSATALGGPTPSIHSLAVHGSRI
jgi:hypothetical protein